MADIGSASKTYPEMAVISCSGNFICKKHIQKKDFIYTCTYMLINAFNWGQKGY